MPLLALNNVEVVYDNVSLAVKGVSIDIEARGLVALLGANGAGKSTVLKAISGLLSAERGQVSGGGITFDGADLLGLGAPERVRRGIAHVLEGRRVFEHLTPAENLLAASSMHRDRGHVSELMDKVMAWFPRLAQRAGSPAGYLSGGEQQMLAIGRALMTEPRLLMLDEPSLGLAPLLVDEIFDIVRRINADAGLSVLLVEQNAVAALGIAQRAYLIENGRVVMTGSADSLSSNPDVQEFYLGGAQGQQKDYHAVKHYRRRKRWLT
ncbi:ABC transporter ATP-binding protein [Variovorax sp. LjRoot175]|uniref:ABC transporter ATP-binding protein n=1 Tax=Variovorax sp. LjRoot175 TaxID=3342276 RepID=UPI003ED08CDB